MLVQLYKSKYFSDLAKENKLSTIANKLSINPYIQEILEYTFNRYEGIDNIMERLFNIPLEDVTPERDYMVISVRDELNSPTRYIWEYYTNWIKLRDNNGNKE